MKGKLLILLSFVMMMVALWFVFAWVPTAVNPDTGRPNIVQRVFYFHVPSAWVAFLAFFLVFIWSIAYLAKRNPKWDMYASSSAEVGLLFTTLVLITGPIWARPEWGVWWTWDLRLTSSLVLWLMYVAYFLIRSYVPDEDKRARFAAVVGIIGFLDVPIVALAIQFARTQHPSPLIFQGGGLAPEMRTTLFVCLATFTLLYWALMVQRIHLKKSEATIRDIRMVKES